MIVLALVVLGLGTLVSRVLPEPWLAFVRHVALLLGREQSRLHGLAALI